MNAPLRLKANKYGAVKTTVDNIRFDSKRESERYSELKLLFKAGHIHNLEIQPRFDFKIDGKHMFTYRGDFAYFEGDRRIIEDVKGVKTAIYKLKKKIIEKAFSVRITEI